MKGVRAASIGCLYMLMASLLLAHVHPFGNAALYATRAAQQQPMMVRSSVPPEVRAILAAKCADCHSTHVRLPLYDQIASRFAPASWLMERDIVEARKRMNLSLWDSYSADQQQTFKALIVEETKTREMPPLQYRLVHASARISDADVVTLTRWSHVMAVVDPATFGEAPGQAAGEGDPVRGQTIFEKQCSGCHSLDKNKEGPKLRDVFGRTSGTAAGYEYSPALKKAAIVWDESSLEKWLSDPDMLVPGNNMDFELAKPQERQDLISFLKQSAGK
jgi:cytochrome c